MFKAIFIFCCLMLCDTASAFVQCDMRVRYRPAHFDTHGRYFPAKHVMAECCTEHHDEFPYGVKGPNAFKCYVPYGSPGNPRPPSVKVKVRVDTSQRQRPIVTHGPCHHRYFRSHRRHHRYHWRYRQ
jgi:hypothetical protein